MQAREIKQIPQGMLEKYGSFIFLGMIIFSLMLRAVEYSENSVGGQLSALGIPGMGDSEDPAAELRAQERHDHLVAVLRGVEGNHGAARLQCFPRD